MQFRAWLEETGAKPKLKYKQNYVTIRGVLENEWGVT
jgi:hypothetical protein